MSVVFVDMTNGSKEERSQTQEELNNITEGMEPIETAITFVWSQIKALRYTKWQTNGFSVTVDADIYWFNSDSDSRTQQLGLALQGTALDSSNVKWKLLDNTYITMTSDIASKLLAAATVSDNAVALAAQAHYANISAMATPAEVYAYDYTTGWPEGYSA